MGERDTNYYYYISFKIFISSMCFIEFTLNFEMQKQDELEKSRSDR